MTMRNLLLVLAVFVVSLHVAATITVGSNHNHNDAPWLLEQGGGDEGEEQGEEVALVGEEQEEFKETLLKLYDDMEVYEEFEETLLKMGDDKKGGGRDKVFGRG